MTCVHETSIVDRRAEIADDVEIGPFCHVHAGARIGPGSRLMSHVVVTGNTTLGASNVVFPFTVIGGDAQVRKGPDTPGTRHALEIGDHNVFRENVTVNTSSGDGTTRIGAHNLFMAGCHVAHDVIVGSRCVIANGVQLAGHVTIEDWVTFGGLAGVAQHLRVGQGAFIAAGAMCERDVPPFVIAQGDRARVRALNVVGLARRAVPTQSIAALRRAFALLWGARPSTSFDEVLAGLDRSDPWVRTLADWLEDPIRRVHASKRSQRT
ncbi:MAG: Acyl-[acyl-carrier-protein]--UDP-N-acetylglucosamine O-acyltransferase [Labilithrix sp.]|nr:Acyl-[acyl-carrier-protein]--UDP-N-acetylglucosamine O-acyltransferase [Labilithrix sp.]